MRRDERSVGQRVGGSTRAHLSAWRTGNKLSRCPAVPLALALLVLMMRVDIARGQDERCVFQINNVDRQGSVNETSAGTNYFAGGNVRR